MRREEKAKGGEEEEQPPYNGPTPEELARTLKHYRKPGAPLVTAAQMRRVQEDTRQGWEAQQREERRAKNAAKKAAIPAGGAKRMEESNKNK